LQHLQKDVDEKGFYEGSLKMTLRIAFENISSL